MECAPAQVTNTLAFRDEVKPARREQIGRHPPVKIGRYYQQRTKHGFGCRHKPGVTDTPAPLCVRWKYLLSAGKAAFKAALATVH
jgi:hypothetical protein